MTFHHVGVQVQAGEKQHGHKPGEDSLGGLRKQMELVKQKTYGQEQQNPGHLFQRGQEGRQHSNALRRIYAKYMMPKPSGLWKDA